jgi:hypothetical protein
MISVEEAAAFVFGTIIFTRCSNLLRSDVGKGSLAPGIDTHPGSIVASLGADLLRAGYQADTDTLNSRKFFDKFRIAFGDGFIA